MAVLSLAAWLLGCNGDDGGTVDPVDDAAPVDASAIDAPAIDARVIDARVIDASPPGVCDPVSPPGQSGCAGGQKCTWILLQDTPERVGQLGCVPAGTVPVGGACVTGAPGVNTGYDDCADGGICIGGTCQDVCGFGGGADEACPTGQACTRYAGIFANGDDDQLAGACRPSCDPITQATCGAGQGCYVLVSQTTTTAVCAGAGSVGHGEAITGQVFANSCLPGHQPRRRDGASQTVECGALCAPAAVTSTTNMASEGGVAPNTCVTRGAAPPNDATFGESCRYWWAREPFDELSPFSNTLGWCFTHVAFQYDTNGDTTPDAPFPRCITLTTGDVVPPIGNPPHNDAQYFWCAPLPAMFARAVHALTTLPAPEPRLDQLAP